MTVQDRVLDRATSDLLDAVSGLDVEATRNALRGGADVLALEAHLKSSCGLVNRVLAAWEAQVEGLHAKAGSQASRMAKPDSAQAIEAQFKKESEALARHAHGVLSVLLRQCPSLPVELSHKGMLPLHLVAFLGHGPTARLLVEHGANPASVSSYGRTAAHWAALAGHAGMLRRLSAWGTALDKQDQGGASAAHLAAGEGGVSAMRQLKRLGANLGLKDKRGNTPAMVLFSHDPSVGEAWEKWERRYEASLVATKLAKELPSSQTGTAPRAHRPRM